MLEVDRGVAGEGPEVRREGRSELCPESGAQRSDLDETWRRGRYEEAVMVASRTGFRMRNLALVEQYVANILSRRGCYLAPR